jgi:hypothetical protein
MLAVTPSAAFLIPDCSTYFPISVRILFSNPALQVVPLRNRGSNDFLVFVDFLDLEDIMESKYESKSVGWET